MAHQNRTNGRSFPFLLLRLWYRAFSQLSPSLAATTGARLFLRTRRHPVPARERALLAGARESHLDTPDGRLPLWTWGTDGPVVVLAHGWEGRGSQLAPFAAPLVRAGFRVVAFDAPGHGRALGRSSTLVLMASALEAVAEEVGGQEGLAGLIAHSAGAVTATYALSRGLRTDRAVFIAPGAGVLDYSIQFADLLGIGEETRRQVQEKIERRIGVAWTSLEPIPLARDLSTPLLVVTDRDDRETALRAVERLADAWPGAKLEITDGLGHRRILRDSRVVGRAVAFLADEALPEAAVEEPLRAVARGG